MNHLSRVLDDTLRRLQLTEAADEARAVMLWPEIVGPQLARVSEPKTLHHGTLVVMVRSSAWNQELTFQKAAIVQKYRARMGKPFIRDLRFVVGKIGALNTQETHAPPVEEVRRIRLPQEEVEEIRQASECEDPELGQAIRRALTHEAQLRQWRLKHGARECTQCGAAHRTPHSICPACRLDRIEGDGVIADR